MAKYIRSYRIDVHINWEDTEDDEYTEYELESDVDFGYPKEIEWFFDELETIKNKEKENE